MSAMVAQIRALNQQGVPADEIAANLGVDLGLIRLTLGVQDVPNEDISAEEYKDARDVIVDMVRDCSVPPNIRLSAAKFVVAMKKGMGGSSMGGGGVSIVVMNQINEAKKRAQDYQEKFIDA